MLQSTPPETGSAYPAVLIISAPPLTPPLSLGYPANRTKKQELKGEFVSFDVSNRRAQKGQYQLRAVVELLYQKSENKRTMLEERKNKGHSEWWLTICLRWRAEIHIDQRAGKSGVRPTGRTLYILLYRFFRRYSTTTATVLTQTYSQIIIDELRID
ncbi:hypothetical protein J6590_069646 [Homalodisca vitripennis]|nr:hypothetical protein J6590_069646 [Homalodisca vitripennis]